MGITAADDKPHESKHIAFMSSQVLNGAGYGIVIRCGDNTFIGNIHTLAGHTKTRETTLQRDVARLVRFIAIVASCMAIVLFSAGLGRKMEFGKAFVSGIIITLVANIPQGLPATVTSMLTLTADRMRQAAVLVKRTDIIESLGAATRIASDKTGTLTQNKMIVMNCWVNCQFKSASDIEAQLHKPIESTRKSGIFGRQSSTNRTSSSLTRTSMGALRNLLSRLSRHTEYQDTDLTEVVSVQGGLLTVTEGDGKAAPPLPRKPGLQRTSQVGQDLLSRMSLGMSGGAAVRPFCTWFCGPGSVRFLLLYLGARGGCQRSGAAPDGDGGGWQGGAPTALQAGAPAHEPGWPGRALSLGNGLFA
jgi:hypothetical protein